MADLKALAKKASEKTKDFADKLDFGEDQTAEDDFYVRFEEASPREVKNPNPSEGMKDTFLAIKVTLLEDSPYQNAGTGLEIRTGVEGTLGSRILARWNESNYNIAGRIVKISTRYRPIKKMKGKKSRVFNLKDVTDTYKPGVAARHAGTPAAAQDDPDEA